MLFLLFSLKQSNISLNNCKTIKREIQNSLLDQVNSYFSFYLKQSTYLIKSSWKFQTHSFKINWWIVTSWNCRFLNSNFRLYRLYKGFKPIVSLCGRDKCARWLSRIGEFFMCQCRCYELLFYDIWSETSAQTLKVILCVWENWFYKGQLISKSNFLVLIWTKNRTKLLFDFCPKDLKWAI